MVFGAFASGKLVGIAGLRGDPLAQVAHKATVWGVFVSPGWRRFGIAAALLRAATTRARAAGVLQLHLAVNTENPRARQLYLALGFVPYGIEPRAMRVGERFYDEEHMALRLDGTQLPHAGC